MCGITIAIWMVCGLIIFAAMNILDNSAQVGLVIGSLLLAVALPPLVTFFMPLVVGWNAANKRLRDRLIADGVLTAEEADSGARPVELKAVMPGTERALPGRGERGLLLFRDGTARFFGENTCWTSSRFKVMPGRSTRCSRCAIIWVCGMAPFRIILEDQERPAEYLVLCREGRKLSRAQHNTDMLAELGMMEDSYEASEHGSVAVGCCDVGDEPVRPQPEPAPAEAAPADDAADTKDAAQ